MKSQYKGVTDIFKVYWSSYGGWVALACSPYLHAALLLLALTFPQWSGIGCGSKCGLWWEQSISVLPNLLGFTLGGFAMFMGLGDEKFRALLAEDDEEKDENGNSKPNSYLILCSTFVHFIVVQAAALIVALIIKAWYFYTPFVDPIRPIIPVLNFMSSALGYGLFLYALMSLVAATMHIFRIAVLFVKQQSLGNKFK